MFLNRANLLLLQPCPSTTWTRHGRSRCASARGTPLHELWLRDPDGTLIEVYARLTDAELAEMPADKEPVFLVR